MSYEWEKTFEYNDKEYTLQVEISVYYDRHYGADADGNRSMPMYFTEVESFDVFDGSVKVIDEDVIAYADKWYDKYHASDSEQQAIENYRDR